MDFHKRCKTKLKISVMSCHVMSCHVMSCHVIQFIWCYTVLRKVVLVFFQIWCHLLFKHITQHNVALYDIEQLNKMPSTAVISQCHVILPIAVLTYSASSTNVSLLISLPLVSTSPSSKSNIIQHCCNFCLNNAFK